MKFTNLVVPANRCDLGEIVRVSNTQMIVQIVEMNVFTIKVRVLSGSGYAIIPSNRNVHRKID